MGRKTSWQWQIDRSPVRLIFSAQVTRVLSRLLLILAIPVLLSGLLQACGGGGGGGGPVTNLKSLTIEPVNSSIAVGTKVQLRATGTFKNKTTKDLTESVTWGSADANITTVSNAAGSQGLATGGGVGVTSVTVKLHGKKGVSTFTVSQASLTSITVEPVNPLVAKGTTVQMSALGNFSDGTVQDLTTQASWSSGNSSIAQVGNTSGTIGLVTGASPGSTPITATFNGIQDSTTVTVTAATLTSITITVPVDRIAKGTTIQLTATCNFSDGTTEDCTSEVSWTSSNSGIAQVSDTAPTKGLSTGVGVGNTTITGTLAGIQGSATATVTAATLASITITPPDSSIAKGTEVLLTATGNFSDGTTQDLTTQVSWTSGDDAIAQVSNIPDAEGLVTGLAVGSTSIAATLGGIEGSTTVSVTAATLTAITITPPNPSIANGTTVQLTATGTFSDQTTQDLTTQVSWTSSADTIAQVSNLSDTEGLVTGVGVGSTSIAATLGGIEGSTTVTVTAATLTAITITPPNPSIANGTTVQLTAIGTFSDKTTQDLTTQVSWTSSADTIAQVSNLSDTEGLVTGVGVGSTSIAATLGGIEGSTTVTVTAATLTAITVTPPNPSIANGTTVQLTAIGSFSDLSTQDLTSQVSWTSAAESFATVDPNGLVTGNGVGSAAITADLGAVSGSATVTVTAATLTSITITPPGPSIANGTTIQLTAIGTYSDLSTQDLTSQVSWTSAAENFATVDPDGLVTGNGVGSATITADLGAVSGSATVTVTAATLTSITITPPNPSIAKGTTVQLTAIGTYSDLSTQDLTSQVHWTSNNPSIASLFFSGLVTGNGVGSATITANLGAVSGSTTVTVTAATLTSITITPPNPSIAKGTTVQLTAIGTYSDLSTQDLTSQVHWTSNNPSIASLFFSGLVTGNGVGSATITANLGAVSGSTTVTVTAATLTSITITPPNPSIAKGTTVQLTAIGTYSDLSTQDLTSQVHWTSNNPSIASLFFSGLVTGNGVGSATITANLGAVSGSTTVTVTAATLTSITITPPNPSIAKGTTVQLTAIGTYSDLSTQDLTSQVHWTSNNPSIASLFFSGLVTGNGVGSATITANLGAVSGSTTVTVTAATLVSIVVTPDMPTLHEHDKLLMMATAEFSDGTMQDVTQQANWTSSDDTVAGIISSSSQETNGELDAKKPGTTTITATIPTLGNITGSTVVTVIP